MFKKTSVKQLKLRINELESEIASTRELNNLLRQSEASLKRTVEQIKRDTMQSERNNLAKSYGQILDSIATGLRCITSPQSF